VSTCAIIPYERENQTAIQDLVCRRNGEHVFGLGTMRLLVEIVRLSSTSAAARELGMSYRYALERLTIVEKRLGILSLKGREVAKKVEGPI